MGIAVIWDLDGTLFDSYPVIVESIYQTFRESGISLSKDEIKEYALRYSSNALFYEVADQRGIAAEALFQRYRQISRSKAMQIAPMDNALKVLQRLASMGVENYVYTHRGTTTIPVLDSLSMTAFFREIITSENGFARKPAPDAIIYLMNKYDLDAGSTYYVGDRSLDMACAKNAGIAGILFQRRDGLDLSCGMEDYIVKDLLQIADILK